MSCERVVRFRTLDGLHLAATLVIPDGAPTAPWSWSTAAASPARKAASLRGWQPGWRTLVWPACASISAVTEKVRAARKS